MSHNWYNLTHTHTCGCTLGLTPYWEKKKPNENTIQIFIDFEACSWILLCFAYAVSSLNQYYRSLVRWKVFGHNVEVCLFVWLIGWMDGFLFEFVFVLILKRQLTQCMQFQWVMQMQTLASLAMCAFQSACFYRDSSPIRTNRR